MGIFDIFKKKEVDDLGNPIKEEISHVNEEVTTDNYSSSGEQDCLYQVIINNMGDNLGELLYTLTSKCGIDFGVIASAREKLPAVIKESFSKTDAEFVLKTLLDLGADAEIKTVEAKFCHISFKEKINGYDKISVIKTIQEFFPTFSLREAMNIVESAPTTINAPIIKEKAIEFKKVMEKCRIKVDIE